MNQASPSSGSASASGGSRGDGRPSPPKRPAGRTKFQETRHPVFRGVRRRGRAGRWVCEVRVPGSRGDRLWVGTFDTAEAAARAHDAAMIALCGAHFAGLNFPDSASLLRVPRAMGADPGTLPEVQRAATDAVAEFMRRHGGGASNSRPNPAGYSQQSAGAASPAASTVNSHHHHHHHETALCMQELDMYGGMDAGSYYASLAEGLLMEPPPPAVGECPEDEECGGGAGMELWC